MKVIISSERIIMTKVRVPFFKQDTIYSCGPTALQMVFLFLGKMESERRLIKKLKTTKRNGTSCIKMIAGARREGFRVHAEKGASFAVIRKFLQKGKPVIVNYLEKDYDEDHYAVVTGINKGMIIMNDPWFGKDFKMEKEEFIRRWRHEDGRDERWLMVVMEKKAVRRIKQ